MSETYKERIGRLVLVFSKCPVPVIVHRLFVKIHQKFFTDTLFSVKNVIPQKYLLKFEPKFKCNYFKSKQWRVIFPFRNYPYITNFILC